MSPNKVPQALTEEEWKQWLAGTPLSEEELGPGFTHHSNAATSLYGQPFGFNPPKSVGGYNTPDYVDAIRFCAEELDRLLRTTAYGMQDDRSIASFAVGFAREAADKIEALLPEKK